MFDVTNEESFHRVTTWLKDLKAHADPDVVICLAGNKIDKKPAFDLSVCEVEAHKLGAKYYKTSALTGEGINEVFESLSISVVELYKNRNKSVDPKSNTVSLNQNNATNNTESSSSCC